MFLPSSYTTALVMMFLGMFFWGSWPNTYKLIRNWRFELFYWDYAVGIFLTSLLIGFAMGTENTFGSLSGQLKQGALTFCRVSTDDLHGKMRAYVGEGEITSDKFQSFGGYGVVRIPRLQEILQYVCENGYEHHVCVNLSRTARATSEALRKYKGWEIHQHPAV